MQRREFIILATATAATWSIVAPAQQSRTRRVGILMSIQNSNDGQARVGALRQALQQAGWFESGNLHVDQRWGAGNDVRIQVYASELVALDPDVIVVNDPRAMTAVQKVTQNIPIVFIATLDPVGLQLVKSMERPGGNVTGFTTYHEAAIGRSLDTLLATVPRLKRVLALSHPDNASAPRYRKALDAATSGSRVTATAVDVRSAAQIESAVTAFAAEPDGGLLILPDGTTVAHRELLVGLAEKHRLPAIYGFRSFVTVGGLMSYGVDLLQLYRRAGSYVDRIFRGARAGDLPVQTPDKYEFLINRKTARTLGIDIPPAVLARAEAVIE